MVATEARVLKRTCEHRLDQGRVAQVDPHRSLAALIKSFTQPWQTTRFPSLVKVGGGSVSLVGS